MTGREKLAEIQLRHIHKRNEAWDVMSDRCLIELAQAKLLRYLLQGPLDKDQDDVEDAIIYLGELARRYWAVQPSGRDVYRGKDVKQEIQTPHYHLDTTKEADYNLYYNPPPDGTTRVGP